MTSADAQFWADLADDLEDPDFLREYVAESVRIATVDRVVGELDAARYAAGLSKAELARAIRSDPATVRRLFSASHVNPTIGTVAEVAAALGLELILRPVSAADRRRFTRPLLDGSTARPAVLAHQLADTRKRRNPSAVR